MVRLRLKRFGRRHHPVYRLCAMDQRTPRDGRAIEELGSYDPVNKNDDAQVNLKLDRIQYWLDNGAQPSETVRGLLVKAGLLEKGPKKITANAKARQLAEEEAAKNPPPAEEPKADEADGADAEAPAEAAAE